MTEVMAFFFLYFIGKISVNIVHPLLAIGNSTGSYGCSLQFWVATASCDITSCCTTFFLAYGEMAIKNSNRHRTKGQLSCDFYINPALLRKGVTLGSGCRRNNLLWLCTPLCSQKLIV
jgi:hypothetical protein